MKVLLLPEGWGSRAWVPEGVTPAWVTGVQSLVSGAICLLLLGSRPQRTAHGSALAHCTRHLGTRPQACRLTWPPELGHLPSGTPLPSCPHPGTFCQAGEPRLSRSKRPSVPVDNLSRVPGLNCLGPEAEQGRRGFLRGPRQGDSYASGKLPMQRKLGVAGCWVCFCKTGKPTKRAVCCRPWGGGTVRQIHKPSPHPLGAVKAHKGDSQEDFESM